MKLDKEFCDCGHHKSEHDRVYAWSPGKNYCSGFIVAYDSDSEGESSSSRHSYCRCTSFMQADDYQINEWEEMGQLPVKYDD